jgi:Ala-tRNA(Pro) deacylase
VLLILSADKRADLKKLSKTMGEEKVIFASADNLKEKLGLEPGSVSPFGLINDKNHDVEVYIEPEVFYADIVSFHPNINTATLELTGEMFIKFLHGTGNKIQVV